ncbi:25S rRNA adenine-N(1) methyltransferase [Mycena indigotica]|uniref:25S rRNA adenine-N(1) methyltransferase n=1 Tax=Mycena indigotica TaxID=2126181 RepID=A0A8H6SBG6_9AGAR|nr:25S rRNA adenine-N(1) methyltransferase [Mycena indigotica]KAF7295257.1 25S rRNA adenine-N(1) methyltransferase [Mycena indigotica]
MGKTTRKRKTPVTTTHQNSSSKPESTRHVIRAYHGLLKKRMALQNRPSRDPEVLEDLEQVQAQIDQLGGLESYQHMSAIGQGHDRGGGSERIAIDWFKEVFKPPRTTSCRYDIYSPFQSLLSPSRLLEVGALKPDNYRSCRSWMKTTPIDLHSRHADILEQDFLTMDETENLGKWDAISLSLVLNFVPEARDRGRMLSLAHRFLVPEGLLFLVLPLPCVSNSRYLTIDHLQLLLNLDSPRRSILSAEHTMQLKILHFNDVYRCAPQKLTPGSPETIDVTQFAALLDGLRSPDSLVLFSGDVFSPSVESSVTRGSHMVPVMNELRPAVALTEKGNHDFDFGYIHLAKLVQATNFPWLLSNIIDTETSRVPAGLNEFVVIERPQLRIGIIGLVEKEWIGTVATWPSNFEYKDMKTVGLKLSKRLRGEQNCDIVIALTHCRVPNDIALARGLNALSPSAQNESFASLQGVDLVLGGHDHLYYASRGMSSWVDYDLTQEVLGAEADNGDVLVCKSGTDFRDLSEIDLELVETPPGSVRRKLVHTIRGKKHSTKPGSDSSPKLKEILDTVLSSVSSSLKSPVCNTDVALDVRSQYIRTEESAVCNWFADIIRHVYDDTLTMSGCGGSDAVLVCAGTFRGDSVYGPGPVTLGDILEILPFEDPIVVIELDGASLWDALESSLATWPAQEGRFPVVSGLRVSWDSRRKPGERVLGVWLTKEVEDSHTHGESGHDTPQIIDSMPIERSSGQTFKIVTREYMAEGHDGFEALKRGRHLIDDESGQIMSTLVRKYLMGSHFVNIMSKLVSSSHELANLHPTTQSVIEREQARKSASTRWKHAAKLALHWHKSQAHYQDHLRVPIMESMHAVDPCDGEKMRRGHVQNEPVSVQDEDLLRISPAVDGRLKDESH